MFTCFKKFYSLFLFLLAANYSLSDVPVHAEQQSPIEAPTTKQVQKNVLLIGIDGLQFEKIGEQPTPNFGRLMIRKAYTGGIDNFSSEQKTLSGPGWSTILTGVWANKHKIKKNGSGESSSEFPSVFKRIHQLNPSLTMASIMNWSVPNTRYFKRDMVHIERVENNLNDEAVTEAAIEEIQKGTDFIFLQLDNIDHAGHQSGFGESYKKHLTIADQQLGKMLDAVEKSTQTASIEWLVLITTDHGREKGGRGHSKQTSHEKTIFIGANRPLNVEYNNPMQTEIGDFNNMYSHPAQTAITPTVLRWLDLPIDPFWLLESPPLVGELAIRKLMPNKDVTLRWSSDFDGKAEIYKNNSLISTVDAQKGWWKDPNPPSNDPVDYLVIIDRQGLSYRSKDYRGIRRLLKWQALERIRKALNISI